jgi:hypothetical protein
MPVDLHERLSEFSYGYGVTREVEDELRGQGLSATPFFPNLIHEAELGFDVGFNLPGVPLLLQFKLGQAVRRFVPGPRPSLAQPFWRYTIDTAEPDGQFELLLKAEVDGAAVYYVAPKFHDWEIYLRAFERREVLDRSLVVRPSTIRQVLTSHSIPDEKHKVVYDNMRAYLCSTPMVLETVEAADVCKKVESRVRSVETPIGETLERIYAGFSERAAIRRVRGRRVSEDSDRTVYAIPSEEGEQPELRQERLNRFQGAGRSREEAIALAVGAEAWSSGAQLIFVTG